MKVCAHRGLVIAILTRNEHCPPHVHVGTAQWEARFEFSFWHNSVSLWDVVPAKNTPTVTLLEELRQVIKQVPNLKQARALWWMSRQTLCLENQMWDLEQHEAVSPKVRRAQALPIQSAHFDTVLNKTVLILTGQKQPLEISL
jgi:hypothetical protein